MAEDLMKNAPNLTLMVNERVLKQVYSNAYASVGFHNIPEDQRNEIKDIAHLAFWVAKLKPILIVDKKNVSEKVAIKVSAVFGQPLAVEPKAAKTPHYCSTFCEELSLWFLRDAVSAIQEEQIACKKNRNEAYLEYKKFYEISNVLFDSQLKSLSVSLRYHNHSARSFATYIEGLFRYTNGVVQEESLLGISV